ncbi:MAG: hypothetical protein AAGC99_11460 [Pseudomonadota bacterium]
MIDRWCIMALALIHAPMADAADKATVSGIEYPSRIAGELRNDASTQHSDLHCIHKDDLVHCALAATLISESCRIRSVAGLLQMAWSDENQEWRTFPIYNEQCGTRSSWILKSNQTGGWSIQLEETTPTENAADCSNIRPGRTTLAAVERNHTYRCEP